MTHEDREAVNQMDIDNATMDDVDYGVYEAAYNTMPPDEEGFDLSYEGGEHEVFEDFANDLAERTG